MKTAIALLTRDKTELTERSVKPLVDSGVDIFWVDGSATQEGNNFHARYPVKRVFGNVRGGAGAAIVFALTEMLKHDYKYVGLCEQDVVLPGDWLDTCRDCRDRAEQDHLIVGAVSARTYVDRVFFQRDGYAVMHNLGAGHILLCREAAQIVLNSFRSGWKTDNRRIFCQLSGIDLGPFWAFGNDDSALVADWHWDATLAAHGYASVAPTPSRVEMIGQSPPLAEQGLAVAAGSVEERIDNNGFEHYRGALAAIRENRYRLHVETEFQHIPEQGWLYVPHQWSKLGASWRGKWFFKEARALGEFAYVMGEDAEVSLPVFGLASILVSGGRSGAYVRIRDSRSGYEVNPVLPPEGDSTQVLQIPLPASISQRDIVIAARTPGAVFYRLTCQNRQPTLPHIRFDYSTLPPPV